MTVRNISLLDKELQNAKTIDVFQDIISKVENVDTSIHPKEVARGLTNLVEASVGEDRTLRVELSMYLETVITDWQVHHDISPLKSYILLACGIPNIRTQKAVRAFVHRAPAIVEHLEQRCRGQDFDDLIDAVYIFYHECPIEFDINYLKDFIESPSPWVIDAKCRLAPLLLGKNPNARGKMDVTHVIEDILRPHQQAVLQANQMANDNLVAEARSLAILVERMPLVYWAENLYRLSNASDITDPGCLIGKFWKIIFDEREPLLLLFHIADTEKTVVANPQDLFALKDDEPFFNKLVERVSHDLSESKSGPSRLILDYDPGPIELAIGNSSRWSDINFSRNIFVLDDFRNPADKGKQK